MRTFILSLFLIAATFTNAWSKDDGHQQKLSRVKVSHLRVSIPKPTDVSVIPVQRHSDTEQSPLPKNQVSKTEMNRANDLKQAPIKNRLGRVRGFMIDDNSDNEDDSDNDRDSQCSETWSTITIASVCAVFVADLFKMYMLSSYGCGCR